MSEQTILIPAEHIRNIYGKYDENIKTLEKFTSTNIMNRDDGLRISGDDVDVVKAAEALKKLVRMAAMGENISVQHLNYLMTMSDEDRALDIEDLMSDVVCFTKAGKPIRPKSFGQKRYVNSIRKNMLTFGIGPAGTGKTYLAMAMAIERFKAGEVNRLILTRPAIEAGERLGFLPGDLQSKIDPYLRPLYDALYEIMGPESTQHNMERGAIEVAPLAYMRGRTLDNAFIILDEAQNTTQAQMKMFLTRLGFGSKAVITGDLTQIDLPANERSGLRQATAILKDIDDIGICSLSKADIVRHPVVQKIVEAYEQNDQKNKDQGGDKPFRKYERK
ncbi:MAG: PhoH family protein [Lachnospiraceae bacterium]|nr:PhoH family protein [Lachnospiraceae bacterium]